MDNSTQGKQELEPLDRSELMDELFRYEVKNHPKQYINSSEEEIFRNANTEIVDILCSKFGTPKTKTVPLAKMIKMPNLPTEPKGEYAIGYCNGYKLAVDEILSLNNFNVTVVE